VKLGSVNNTIYANGIKILEEFLMNNNVQIIAADIKVIENIYRIRLAYTNKQHQQAEITISEWWSVSKKWVHKHPSNGKLNKYALATI